MTAWFGCRRSQVQILPSRQLFSTLNINQNRDVAQPGESACSGCTRSQVQILSSRPHSRTFCRETRRRATSAGAGIGRQPAPRWPGPKGCEGSNPSLCIFCSTRERHAQVLELVDNRASEARAREGVRVRVPPCALFIGGPGPADPHAWARAGGPEVWSDAQRATGSALLSRVAHSRGAQAAACSGPRAQGWRRPQGGGPRESVARDRCVHGGCRPGDRDFAA